MKPFNSVAVNPTEPENGADVWIKHGKNLFNGNLSNTAYNNTNRNIVNNDARMSTDKMKINKADYIISVSNPENLRVIVSTWKDGTWTGFLNSGQYSTLPYIVKASNTFDEISTTFRKPDDSNISESDIQNLKIKQQVENDILLRENDGYVSFFDSEWEDLELENGAEAYSESYKPQIKKIGNIIFLRGVVKKINVQGFNFAKIPTDLIPTQNVAFVNRMNSDGSVGTMLITPAGHLQLLRNSKQQYLDTDFYAINTSYTL